MAYLVFQVSDNPDVRASIAPADDDALDGMAGALQRALQQRAKVIQPGESGRWS